jgi:hypothetical protein
MNKLFVSYSYIGEMQYSTGGAHVYSGFGNMYVSRLQEPKTPEMLKIITEEINSRALLESKFDTIDCTVLFFRDVGE